MPVAVGIGISTTDQASQASTYADVVMVGSAVIRRTVVRRMQAGIDAPATAAAAAARVFAAAVGRAERPAAWHSPTACGAGMDAGNSGTRSPGSSSAAPAPAGVVTPKTAAAAVGAYERAHNQANKRRDAALLSTVGAGQVHEQSRADYKTFKTWSAKDKKKYGTPFFCTDRQYLIPAKGTASWFAVKTKTSGDAAKASDDHTGALLIFDRVCSVYKLVFALYADETPIPKVAVDRHGLATAIDPSKRIGTLAPTQLGVTFNDLLETGGKKQGAALSVTKATKEATETYRTRDQEKNSKWATTRYFAAEPARSKAYALRLASGGVPAVFPMAHTCEVMLPPST